MVVLQDSRHWIWVQNFLVLVKERIQGQTERRLIAETGLLMQSNVKAKHSESKA
jgi:hypothetical protein